MIRIFLCLLCGLPILGQAQAISDLVSVSDSLGSMYFGKNVAISGQLAIVGDPGKTATSSSGSHLGVVSFYRFAGGTWQLIQRSFDPLGDPDAQLGISVSISGNYAIAGTQVGGVAIIFRYDGANWTQMQRIQRSKTGFGRSVSISGTFAAIGSPLDDAGRGATFENGAVYIYRYSTSWTLAQTIIDATGAQNDRFGQSVALSGNDIIIGAPEDDVASNANQGSASIFRYNGTNWSLARKLTDNTGAAQDRFGYAVSIESPYAIAGAPYDDHPNNTDKGSAIIYELIAGVWAQSTKLVRASGATNDHFGSSVSINLNYAIVGSPHDDIGTLADMGSAVFYERSGSSWPELQTITDPAGHAGALLGESVHLDRGSGRNFIIGSSEFRNLSYLIRGKALLGFRRKI